MRRRMDRSTGPDAVGELGDLISRMTEDVAREESLLRERIIDLIEKGDTATATALLRAWNATAAGDLLKTLAENTGG